MNDVLKYSLLAGAIVLVVVGVIVSLIIEHKKDNRSNVRYIARVSVFGALSAILYCVPFLTFKLPFLPSFLSIHLDEIPIFIVGFAYGPWSAVGVIVVKTLIKLPLTTTLTVGELGDLFYSLVFILPSAILYQKRRKLSSVFIGFGISMVTQLLVAMIFNVYVMIPFYMLVMGLPEDAILSMCQAANPNIKDVGWSYALFAVLPMNAIKNGIVLVATFFMYKGLRRFLKLSWTAKRKQKASADVELYRLPQSSTTENSIQKAPEIDSDANGSVIN